MQELNLNCKAFLNEASFTKQILGLGATRIRKANYAFKGIYYEVFTCLTTGLERIGKICIILDYYIQNSGSFPDAGYLKREIGHNLTKLYEKAILIKQNYNFIFEYKNDLNDEIYKNILSILTDFAIGDRYSNINLLLNTSNQSDPIRRWVLEVDNYIYDNYVNINKKRMIDSSAKAAKILLEPFSCLHFIAENGDDIFDIEQASFLTGKQEAVAPFRQLFILQIIRFWAELIEKLQYEAQKVNPSVFEIPYFNEIFAGFYNNDSYFKSRKTWDNI